MNLSQKIEKSYSQAPGDKFLLGDTVIVTTGRAKKEIGVLQKRIRTREGLRYIIAGCNYVIKHKKPDQKTGNPGGRIKVEASIHSSNVAIYNLSTQKADKIRFIFEDGKKIRQYKSTGEQIAHHSSLKDKE
jgi:large subunit ribosomal protein L24